MGLEPATFAVVLEYADFLFAVQVFTFFFSKALEKTLRPILMAQQPIEQAGFRKHYSTIDHLHTINQLIEKSREYQIEIHIALIDYNKAFDSVEHNFIRP